MTDVGKLLESVLAVVKSDLTADVKKAVGGVIANVIAVPTTQNVVAQLLELQLSLAASGPTIESQLIKDVATLLQQQLSTPAATA